MNTTYNIGDQFLVEITDISSTGMGTVYYLDDCLTATNMNIDKLTKYTPVTNAHKKSAQKKAHTPEELKNKIFALSSLLAATIEQYQKIMSELNTASETLDIVLESESDG